MRHLTGECCKMSTTNFSKECFYDALISLCKTENFNDINIKQICKKAGYNHSTFYRHFNCKEDIIRDKARDLIANWNSTLKFELGYSFENFVSLFEYLRGNDYLFLLMQKLNMQEDLFRLSYEYLHYNYDVNEYDLVFVNNGILAVVVRWINNGLQESNEYMAKLLSKYVKLDLMQKKNNNLEIDTNIKESKNIKEND